MKVLLIQDGLINAGSEKSHLEIYSRFSNKIHSSVVYFYQHHELKSAYESAGIPLHFIGLKGRYNFVRGVLSLIRVINRERPHLMVSCLMRSNLMARVASALTRTPLVGTLVNDSYCAERIKEYGGWGYIKFKLFWSLDKLTSGIPVHWISNASALVPSHKLALGIDAINISVIYRGRSTNIKQWLPGPKMHGFTFISYGRFIQRKGFQELIIAFSIIKKMMPESRLIVYGDGKFRKTLVNLVKSHQMEDSVSLPGSFPDVFDRLGEADCFVFPSWYEGFSGALVEAMMTGIPIIASDIPMNMEAITPGVNGLSFKVKDVNDLADKMKYAVSHREEMAALGAKAREDSMLRFDIDNIAKQYELKLIEIYSNLKKGI